MSFLGHFHLGGKHATDSSSQGSHEPERGRSVWASGRGGAGNMHRNAEHEEKINDKEASQRLANVHIGRGGAGNVRSPSRDRAVREQYDEDRLREMEQQKRLQSEALEASVRASGRGGRGNIPVPPSHEVERGRSRTSSPRGAVAGVLRSISRSRSQDARSSPGARARSTSRARSSGLGRVQEDS